MPMQMLWRSPTTKKHNNDDNDDTYADLPECDSHGHAARLLTESLIHSLIDNSTIDLAEAHNVVTIAIDATEELAESANIRPASLERSISLLTDIKHSLGHSE